MKKDKAMKGLLTNKDEMLASIFWKGVGHFSHSPY